MKNSFKITLCCILAVSVFAGVVFNVFGSAAVQTENGLPLVIIDAGHGGFDGGAVAEDGTTEKQLNLEISEKLKDVLTIYGFKTMLTRSSDEALSNGDEKSGRAAKTADLKKRVAIANANADNAIFVSIHQNKFDSAKEKGFQVFYKNGNESARLLAESVQSSVCRNIQPQNKRVAKPDNRKVFILENIKLPAVIAECGFISNSEDLAMLKSDDSQMLIAFCIANGISEYCCNMEAQNNDS